MLCSSFHFSSILQLDSFQASVLLCAGSSWITFVVSTLTRNYSQVDKLWSILPALYAGTTLLYQKDNAVQPRALLVAVLVALWSGRLTYNFSRRGGYKWPQLWQGDQDYRWKVLQKAPVLSHPLAWSLFNLGFISVYQNLLLLWIAAPAFVVQSCSTTTSLHLGDIVLAGLFLFFLAIETVADNQQYEFQTEKNRRKNNGVAMGTYADGFCQSGLFAIVRKPNYAAEQAMWIVIHLFCFSAGAPLLNWAGIGSLLLLLLFQGSGWFTEKITMSKYRKYKIYMEKVPSRYLPNPFLKSN